MNTNVRERRDATENQSGRMKNGTAGEKNEIEEEKISIKDNLLRMPLTSVYMKKSVAVAYILSLLFNISFFMQLMILPYLTKPLGMTSTEFGILQAFAGMLQVGGSLVYGYLIKQYGTKRALTLCYASTMISAFIKYFAMDRTMLYISMIPNTFMNGLQCHLTLLAALTKPGQERTKAFGRIGLTFGLGFLFAPLLSVTCTKLFGTNSILIAAAFIAFMKIAICLSYLSDDIDKETNQKDGEEKKDKKETNLKLLLDIAERPNVLSIFLGKISLITPVILVFSILQIHLMNQFNASPTTNSMIQAYFGILLMVSNGLALPKLRERYNEENLFVLGTISLLIGNVLLTQTHFIWMLLISQPFICFGMSLAATVADSMLTSAVHKSEESIILGVTSSADALTRAIGPGMAGYLLEHSGFATFGVIGAIVSAAVILTKLPVLTTILKPTKSAVKQN